MLLLEEDLIKLLVAIVVGGAIGLEREFRDKAAGFRTLIFICVGATLFTLFSAKLAGQNDPTRIAANFVSGVGFLGGGQYALVLVMTGLTLVVLWGFPVLEHWIDNIREERTYEVIFALQADKYRALETLFRESRLRIVRQRQSKAGLRVMCSWQAIGTPRSHEQLIERLLADPDIDEFRF